METRVALISIIVSDMEKTTEINNYLHEVAQYVIGRMGVPYKEKNIAVISVAIDAPQDVISNVSGKIGKLDGVTIKTAYSKM